MTMSDDEDEENDAKDSNGKEEANGGEADEEEEEQSVVPVKKDSVSREWQVLYIQMEVRTPPICLFVDAQGNQF